jgi:predicted O-methyltransferase YrrM
MNSLKNIIRTFLREIRAGRKILEDETFINTIRLTHLESLKTPSRTEILNFLLSLSESENYLEIGVRNPQRNFDKINCKRKYSVDPGLEFEENPVDFVLTSDDFFKKLGENKLKGIDNYMKFDVIFIDGLHMSSQVEKDILNSLNWIKEEGFIVLHDCNPPSEYHQREDYYFRNSPADKMWNGTTWKAFYKFRHRKDLYSICFDTDWGVGVISRKKLPLFNNISENLVNEFYEYCLLDQNRDLFLNMQLFENWVNKVKNIQ